MLNLGSRFTSNQKKLAENIASLYILQGLNYAIPLAVLPYLVRVLGMEMYGLLAFAQSFAQYFTILTDYGFNFSATRALAQAPDDGPAASQLFSSVLVLKLIFCVLGGLVLWGVVLTVPRFHQDAPYFYAGYLAVTGNVLFPVWYYQGIQQMRYISIVSGGARLISAVALFVFVHRPQDTLLALVIQSCGILLSGIAGFTLVLVRFQVRFVPPSLRQLRTVLADGWHLFVSTAAVSLYTNTNVFLVGLLAGDVEAGYFSAAEKIVRAMNGLIGPISQAIFPHVNSLVQQSRASVLRFARKTLALMIPATAIPSLALLLGATPIARICFGGVGAGSIPVIRWIAFLPMIIAVSNVLGVQTMIPFGLDKQFSRILILAGILNVLLAAILIKRFGAQGAGSSVLVVEAYVTVAMLISLKRHNLSVFPTKEAS